MNFWKITSRNYGAITIVAIVVLLITIVVISTCIDVVTTLSLFGKKYLPKEWNEFEKNSSFPDGYSDLFGPEWFFSKKSCGVKYTNAFKLIELLFIDSLSMDISRELDPPSGFRELGIPESVKLLDNVPTMDFFKKSISIPCRIFFVKALDGHRIEKGKLKYFSKFQETLREATKILYCFGNDFGNGVMFRKEMSNGLHKFYVPERNSIICFTNQDTYELIPIPKWSSKIGLRYFMVILIFGNPNTTT